MCSSGNSTADMASLKDSDDYVFQ